VIPIPKWYSNQPAMLKALSRDQKQIKSTFCSDNTDHMKTLGFSQHPTSEKFQIGNKAPKLS
jgi:hypothetical protein